MKFTQFDRWMIRNGIVIFAAMFVLLAAMGAIGIESAFVGFVGYCSGRNWGIMEKNTSENGKPEAFAMLIAFAVMLLVKVIRTI